MRASNRPAGAVQQTPAGTSGAPGQHDHATRLPSITGLRFIAAFGVFGYHVLPLAPRWGVLHPLLMAGQAGVSFFFVLSGFVLTWSDRPGDGAVNFWRRRVARIVPTHLLTWAVGIPVTLAVFGALPRLWPLVGTFTLTQAWFPDKSVFFGVNGVAWSLSCEALFYALFPVLIVVVRRTGARSRLWLMAGCVLTLAVWQLGLWFVTGGAVGDAVRVAFWLVSVIPLGRLPEFVLGMLAARHLAAADERAASTGTPAVWLGGLRLPGIASTALLTLIALYLAGCFPIVVIAGWLTVVPFVLLICAAAQSDLSGRPGLLATTWAVRLGEWSFAFYMCHQLVLRSVQWLAGRLLGWSPPVHGWWPLQIGVDLALALLAAALCYRYLEVPAERRLRPIRRG
jgi:peptidoglycan/LPS O-acetylase OafA/YrhL